ncbi:MAG: glycosyltransferase family 9 protein [Bacteroidales bacterium]|nr:glycosyltransferase family 9 protein [Bacteroidales bacterium]
MKKILFIRFSSIGDIVLTTPVVRAVKQQLNDVEIHFLTKERFLSVIEENPYINKVYTIREQISEVKKELKRENYDYIIDLHHNLRTLHLKSILRKPCRSFNKLNFEKWLLVKWKINRMPEKHIVDRCFDAASELGVKYDGQGLDYFIHTDDEVSSDELPIGFKKGYVAVVIGGAHATKQLPKSKLIELCDKLDLPILILGGPAEETLGDELKELFPEKIYNTAGKFSLNRSASLVKNANVVVTSDTGLMHIAAAFRKKIVSIWGNTVPEFGMYPFLPQEAVNYESIEVKDLDCRPCSKIGFKKCPKGHFDCMMKISIDDIVEKVTRLYS